MKQLKTVFKFEYMNYAKAKSFIAITLVLMILVALLLSFPRISQLFSGSDETGAGDAGADAPTSVALLDTTGDSETAAAYFNTAMQGMGYRFQPVDGNAAELEAMVDSGEYGSGIAIEGPLAFTRYVSNTDLYDAFSAIFSEVMLARYRAEALSTAGVPEAAITDILSAQVQTSTITTAAGKDGAQNFLYTYILIMMLYFIIVLYGNMVASSVATEKSTRAMELLITSAKPTNLMFGKVFGAGLAGLTQFALILVTAFVFYNFNASYFADNAMVQSIFAMPLSLMLYTLLFFILGFFIYAFLFASLASLVSRMEDLSQATMPALFLLIIAFFVVVMSISSGTVNNPAMVVCSFIPFTSPMAMFARIAMGNVAGWEIIISVALLVISTLAIGYFAAAIYRLGVLLYGNAPKPKEIIKMLRANKAAKKAGA